MTITRPSHLLALATVLALAATSGTALGAVYKWKDATGRVQLSDQPPKDVDAEILHVAPANTQAAPPASAEGSGGAQAGGSTSTTTGVAGKPVQDNALGSGSASASGSTSAATAAQAADKSPEEVARENRKIRQARREKCNTTLTRLLSRGNTTRTAQPSKDLREELRENCK